jgi:hypothetical protein
MGSGAFAPVRARARVEKSSTAAAAAKAIGDQRARTSTAVHS